LQDAPGTWQKFPSEYGVPFYYNKDEKLSQYHAPPSCAWVKGYVENVPIYTNKITHQSKWKIPNALAWKQLHSKENDKCGLDASREFAGEIELLFVTSRVPKS
jgi:hypothetical protein